MNTLYIKYTFQKSRKSWDLLQVDVLKNLAPVGSHIGIVIYLFSPFLPPFRPFFHPTTPLWKTTFILLGYLQLKGKIILSSKEEKGAGELSQRRQGRLTALHWGQGTGWETPQPDTSQESTASASWLQRGERSVGCLSMHVLSSLGQV